MLSSNKRKPVYPLLFSFKYSIGFEFQRSTTFLSLGNISHTKITAFQFIPLFNVLNDEKPG